MTLISCGSGATGWTSLGHKRALGTSSIASLIPHATLHTPLRHSDARGPRDTPARRRVAIPAARQPPVDEGSQCFAAVGRGKSREGVRGRGRAKRAKPGLGLGAREGQESGQGSGEDRAGRKANRPMAVPLMHHRAACRVMAARKILPAVAIEHAR